MKTLKYLVAAAVALAGPASAGDLMAVEQAGKGGAQRLVALEYLPSAGDVAFEFEYVLPQDAKAVDVSRCAKSVPATHTAYCDYRASEQKVLVIVTGSDNAQLPLAGLDLGFVSYTSASKPAGDRVTGLVVANERGEAVESRAHVK